MSLNAILASNFILLCDTYKYHHYAEYPEDTAAIYSTVVPRKASHYTEEIVAAGAAFVAAYLANVTITHAMINEAEAEVNGSGYEFNRQGWEIIVRDYSGKLPLQIFGVEEGTVVKPNTPILGIVNNDVRLFWLVSYVETVVQRIMWKMTTTASLARFIYKWIDANAKVTGADRGMVEWRLHNFGDRGADGEDAAIMAAMAHAMLFSGSDCGSVNRYIKAIYNTKRNYTSSVDATEHSVMCSHSDAEAKDDFGAAVMAVERLEEAVARTKRGIGIPLQSVVIDTYDDERFVKEYIGTRLKDRVIASGGVLVLRPDSGDPVTKPLQVIQWLEEKFGITVNEKGFKTLPPYVRVIQGDGINEKSIPAILSTLWAAGYSTDNLVLGMGGGLTHGGSRDAFSFSMKATARMLQDGTWVDLLKEPKTDSGKKSLKGLVRTRWDADGNVETFQVESNDWYEMFTPGEGWQEYFNYGNVKYVPDFDEVRARARVG